MLTERLTLRPVAENDIDTVIEIHGDPAATRDRAEGPSTPAESVALLAGWIEHWLAHGFGYWAIVHTETGEVVGLGGVQHSEFEGEHYLNMYYRFRPSAWGNGYAPEMGAAAMSFADAELPGIPVRIVTNHDNAPACRVAEKLGFELLKTGDYRGTLARFYQWRGSGVGTPGATRSTKESSTRSA